MVSPRDANRHEPLGVVDSRRLNSIQVFDDTLIFHIGTVVIVIETDTKENVDHLISREDLLNILMTRQ